MKMPNLKDFMISITDVKKQLSEVINNRMTKVIVKNNEPVSVIMPYNEYIEMTEIIEEGKATLNGTGQDITLKNGVQIMVVAETTLDKTTSMGDIAIKTYVKMKTSGDYKLHYTLHLGSPSIEETLTSEELRKHYFGEEN